MPRSSWLGLLFCLILAVGCNRAAPAPPAPPPPVVTVAKPVAYKVQPYYEYNGYLDAVETVQVKARVKGLLSKIHFNEGDDIAAGKLLYTIDPREYDAVVARAAADIEKAVADAANADAQVKQAEAELARLRSAGTAVAPTEVDKAVATAAAYRAQRKVADANKQAGEAAKQTAELDREYTTITAPIAGRISRTLVTQGNLVGQNETTLLTTIVRMDELFVYFDAPERDLVEALRAGRESSQPATLPVEVGVATEEGFPHKGMIDFRENRVDPGTGTIRVRGRLKNPPAGDGRQRPLYAGLFARVRVPAGPERSLPVVPEDAVQNGQEGTFLYVLGEGNVVQKRTVTVGRSVWRMPANGGKPGPDGWALVNPKPTDKSPAETVVRSAVAVEKGLAVTDVVVVAGLQRARPGAPVAPDEWTIRPPAGK